MTTQQRIQHAFKEFCNLYNLKTEAKVIKDKSIPHSPYYSNTFIKLDHNCCYGGYRLDIVQTNTGESSFDGAGRRSAKEMLSYLQGLIVAKTRVSSCLIIEIDKLNKKRA